MTEPPATAPALPARWRLLTVLTASYGAGAFGMLGISLAGLLFSLPGAPRRTVGM